MAHSESENYMSVTFFGTKNLPKKDAVCMSWAIDPDPTDAAVQQLEANPFLPPGGNGPWLVYSLNPVDNQGAFTFGVADALQIQISTFQPTIIAADEIVSPGRVMIYVPATGQIYVFVKDDMQNPFATLGATNTIIRASINAVVPVSIPNGAVLQVWFEYDDENTSGVPDFVAPSSAANVTLFNVPISPVAA